MIKENQRIFNSVHILTDGLVIFLSFPAGFWLRFHVFKGIISVPLRSYISLAAIYTIAQLITYAAFGLYQSFRAKHLRKELVWLWEATLLDTVALQSLLFLSWGIHYSRWILISAFLLCATTLSAKRIILRGLLRRFRQKGYNQKHVLIAGSGALAERYLAEIRSDPELGYCADGYVSAHPDPNMKSLKRLGGFDKLHTLLEEVRPDEVVAALNAEDFRRTPEIIAACEGAGVRLSIIPFYAEYTISTPQLDELNGIPLLNIRHIPLDNCGNAFCKRALDIAGSVILLILLSPIMLISAIGVKLSSPGPVIFKQERMGKDRRRFYMYKFRSMRLNDAQDTAWSGDTDERRTRFGALMRKCSLDELPQLWNVLKGDMSLVGPRPEIPYYVERFRDEVPVYMVKHQVRPGITGWAQINGYRGDTSIRRRIEHDVYYIENWSLGFDLEILLKTVFGGKFLNNEKIDEIHREEMHSDTEK